MTVDLEAIARRTNCELTSLKSALPLLEQGYAPPFLARYRRDELGGLSEHAMWTLYRAMREDAWIRNRRDDLMQRLEQLPQVDPAITRAVRSASSKRVIDRLARRVRSESSEAASPYKRLAARVLSPEKGDPGDVPALAALLGLSADAVDNASAVDAALISRLAIHPQMQATAVRWLFNNAKIRIVSVSDTHADPGADAATDEASSDGGAQEELTGASVPSSAAPAETDAAASASDQPVDRDQQSAERAGSASTADANDPEASQELEQDDAETAWPTPEELAEAADSAASADQPAAPEHPATGTPSATGKAKSKQKGKAKAAAKVKELKTVKKVSPRQRRRRWLVSVLQPLAGKEILAQRLTAFQILMIGRGLRTGVVQCQFVYDTLKLTEQLQRTAAGLNEAFASKMRELVTGNDSVIRE
ncbi:MAG: Tex-like N-terminal domain-containing protein, partial [Planctomycetaceae bacterium]